MSGPALLWVVFTPLIAGCLSVLVAVLPAPRFWQAAFWKRTLALLLACLGPLMQGTLLVASSGSYLVPGTGISLASSPSAQLGMTAVDAALVSMLLMGRARGAGRVRGLGWPIGAALSAALLGLALLATDPAIQVVALFAASLVAAVMSGYPLPRPPTREQVAMGTDTGMEIAETARSLAGGIKHLGLATLATLLLTGGVLLLSRFALHMEATATLGAGMSLLSVGLAVRSGVLPFSGGPTDILRSAPRAAVLVLGAVVPASLITGATIIGPLAPRLQELPQWSRGVALALGGIGALLAGLRALAWADPREKDREGSPLALLVAASVGLQTAWALFGLLSGTREGLAGSVLLAANLAIVVPLMQAAEGQGGGRGVPLWIGAGSLLGAPPFGGFPGTLLVGIAAVRMGGWWLALLALGSLLVAIAWTRAMPLLRGAELPERPGRWGSLLPWALAGAQILLVCTAPLLAAALMASFEF